MFFARRRGSQGSSGNAGTSIAQIWREHVWALRRLSRSTGFTAVVAVTLGLAIGGNAAIYSVVHAVLLKPLPYPDPNQLVRVFSHHPRFGITAVSSSDFHAMRDGSTVFAGVAGFYREGHEFNGSLGPENLEGLFVTADYFELLGGRAALGRTFTRADEHPAADRVILSDRIWRTRLGADPDIIGRTVHLSRRPFEIIGVMSPGVEHVGGAQRSLRHGETADFWLPLHLDPANPNRMGRILNAMARLVDGVTLAQANAELARLAALQEQRWPATHTGWRSSATPLINDIVGAARPVLVAVFGAVACVLLIACGNVACLTLARSTARTREHAVRAALGASRGTLAREILVESWLLALLGACLGIPLAIAGVQGLIQLAPAHLPRLHAIRVDAGMLVFGAVVTFVTSLLCGILPAWYGARTNLDAALRESGRSEAPGHRSLLWHRALVVGQLALCFVLLVCAGLLARTFYRLQQDPIGFQPQGVMTMTFDLPGAVTKYGRDVNERAAFHERLLRQLRALPGVISVGTASRLPFAEALDSTDAPGRVRFTITDRPVPPDERPFARMEVISSGYLQTLGIPLLEGRDFDARDTLQSAPVVLVNQELVRRYMPGDGVVGRTLLDVRRIPPTVVGVVGNVKPTPVALTPEPTIYVAMSQSPIFRTRLAIRAHGDPVAVMAMVRRTVASLDPELPVFDIKPLEGIAADAVATQRFALMLFGLFAALALGLGVLGIYGVLAYAVAHRVPEFGVRLALGARPEQLLQMVLAQGARMTLLGLALGAGVSMLATRWIRGLLFGVQPFDPVTLGGVALLFWAIAMAACLLPARRAAGIEPLAALRNE